MNSMSTLSMFSTPIVSTTPETRHGVSGLSSRRRQPPSSKLAAARSEIVLA